MSRLSNMLLHEFTVRKITRSCLFLFGAVIIFCVEATLINHAYNVLPTRLDTAPATTVVTSPLQIAVPIWFEVGKKQLSTADRELFIETTQFLLILSSLVGAAIGVLLRPRPYRLVLMAIIGSCVLSSLFINSFPDREQIVIVAGCTSFCFAAVAAALPYTLWHHYLRQK